MLPFSQILNTIDITPKTWWKKWDICRRNGVANNLLQEGVVICCTHAILFYIKFVLGDISCMNGFTSNHPHLTDYEFCAHFNTILPQISFWKLSTLTSTTSQKVHIKIQTKWSTSAGRTSYASTTTNSREVGKNSAFSLAYQWKCKGSNTLHRSLIF